MSEIKRQKTFKPIYRPGLRNVITGETKICLLDEKIKPAMFFYYGYSIADLAKNSTFEEVAYLLLYGNLPTREELRSFEESLTFELNRFKDTSDFGVEKVFKSLELHPPEAHPMDILRSLISFFGANDLAINKEDDLIRRAIRLCAIMPIFVAAVGCHKENKELHLDRIFTSQAKNFLYFFRGSEADELECKILNTSLILYAEHEFNASATAIHLITSSNSDIYSAVCGAIGSLKGNLHGGANEAAMKLLLEIGDVNNVEDHIRDKLAKREKIMGFGHPVYKKGDPRCPIMKPILFDLSRTKFEMKWFEMSERIEKFMLTAKKGKRFYPNIDFWTAPAYYLLNIPVDLYTPIFVMSRITGWCAHHIEYKSLKEPLMRPRAYYTGPEPREYVPIGERGEGVEV